MNGPCAKRRVQCRIVTESGHDFIGENSCENPQPVCPRAEGEGYEKCKSICRQGSHAEIEALRKAEAAGVDVVNATATLIGHHWICEPCGLALAKAGIWAVTICYGADRPTGRVA